TSSASRSVISSRPRFLAIAWASSSTSVSCSSWPSCAAIAVRSKALALPAAHTAFARASHPAAVLGLTPKRSLKRCSEAMCKCGVGAVVCQRDGAVPEDGGAVPEDGGAIPEDGTAIPEDGTAIPEDGAAIPENGAAIPENGAAIPEDGA